MNLAEELQKLRQLHETGAINNDEYAQAKAKLLGEQVAPGAAEPSAHALEKQTRQWAMLLHFSLLAGFVVPFAGLVLPVMIWQLKKDELPGIDRHGRIVVNWIISEIIYAFVCFLLAFVIIGIPLLIALAIIAVVFPIIGGVKANDGVIWVYPLSMSFVPAQEPAAVGNKGEEHHE